ncbi:hypothetical protein F7310_00075 [Francisella uliginis]|uniref:Uncharacterized protein n=2 Tax=Francisella uliginis TaxID=573570 RepID=A0A1L4BPT0_9GAMM|nr:hypothetical protein F7310_00075 [Francisella uliginis]
MGIVERSAKTSNKDKKRIVQKINKKLDSLITDYNELQNVSNTLNSSVSCTMTVRTEMLIEDCIKQKEKISEIFEECKEMFNTRRILDENVKREVISILNIVFNDFFMDEFITKSRYNSTNLKRYPFFELYTYICKSYLLLTISQDCNIFQSFRKDSKGHCFDDYKVIHQYEY